MVGPEVGETSARSWALPQLAKGVVMRVSVNTAVAGDWRRTQTIDIATELAG